MNFNTVKKLYFCCLIVSLLLISSFTASTAWAQPQIEQQANQIFSEINSPFCKGRLLRDCPSSGASQLKEEIRSMLQEGADKPSIISSLYERYGEDEIRAIPTNSNIGRFAWIAPFLFIILAALAIILWLRRNMGDIQSSSGNN